MFDPTVVAFDQDAKHGLRPPNSTREVVRRDDNCRGDENLPVTIKRQKRQRTKHVKVGLDPAARQVNQ